MNLCSTRSRLCLSAPMMGSRNGRRPRSPTLLLWGKLPLMVICGMFARVEKIQLTLPGLKFTCTRLAKPLQTCSMINFLNPSVGICCNQAMGKGKLRLVGYGQLGKLDPNCTYKVDAYSLYSPTSCNDMEKWDEKSVVIPILHIQACARPDQANITLTHSNKGCVQIPVLVSSAVHATLLLETLCPQLDLSFSALQGAGPRIQTPLLTKSWSVRGEDAQ